MEIMKEYSTYLLNIYKGSPRGFPMVHVMSDSLEGIRVGPPSHAQ